MRSMRFGVAGLMVLGAMWVAPRASAQTTRTWLSGVGDDANPCSRTAPCKTFVGAFSKTAASGMINALDASGYGNLTITKSMTLDGSGSMASILASASVGIIVNAGDSDTVVLRDLDIGSPTAAPGTYGVNFIKGKLLIIEDCRIHGFSKSAVRAASTTAGARVIIRRSSFVNNGAGVEANVEVASGSILIEKSHLSVAGKGLSAATGTIVTVYDTVIAHNVGAGVSATGSAQVHLEKGLVAHNGVGIDVEAESTAVVQISDVMIAQNTTGVQGNVVSFGNNRIAAGNGTNGAPVSVISQQ